MATVQLYLKEGFDEKLWRKSGKTLADEVEGFFDEHFEEIERKSQNGETWMFSFRETFYSSAKRIPGIYWEKCKCGMPANAPMVKIILEETGENTCRVRIYGHRRYCVKQEYDRLRQGRLFPKVRWDGEQVKNSDQDAQERYEGAYPNISCPL